MIKVKGASQNNLKAIDFELPDEKLIVITGVSGSGKSSLAFDTIYAEGQRRYVETFSVYARQFLEQLEKPLVDSIEGLSPSISIDQKTGGTNPRSTVGTVTECYDYLRLLFARVGKPFCPACNIPIEAQSVDNILFSVNSLPVGSKIQILSPVVRAKKGEHRELLSDLASEGFSRVRVDGDIMNLSDEIRLARYKIHDIEVVVDRLKVVPHMSSRLVNSLQLAIDKGRGTVIINISGEKDLLFSRFMSCPLCKFSLDEITPRMFSFNNSYGACQTCQGMGFLRKLELSLLVDDWEKTILDGAIPLLKLRKAVFISLLKKIKAFGKLFKLDLLKLPLSSIKKEIIDLMFYGSSEKSIELSYKIGKNDETFQFKSRFPGIIPYIEQAYSDEIANVRRNIIPYMAKVLCQSCKGMRLRKESLAVKVGNKSLGEISRMDLKSFSSFLSQLNFDKEKELIAKPVIREIISRIDFLIKLGVGYLTLERTVSTLAGGEIQRIRIATQIGSGLVGVLYILDEPTIGLHQRDNASLIETLEDLREAGNTVIVVEHDEQTMRRSDYILDLGPGSGISGGYIVASGKPEDIIKNDKSLTGQYLSGKIKISVRERKVSHSEKKLYIKEAGEHNLKNIDVAFPLGLISCVTGVSGSGKSTLVYDILYRALARDLHHSRVKPGLFKRIIGTENLDKVIMIDQVPIGRTPRSNPATYTNVFTPIRELFTLTPRARLRGYKKGRFSFNLKGGRCEKCLGSGKAHIEMHFLPDIYVTCDECKGKRYNSETLEVEFKGKNIFEVLQMTVSEGREFFKEYEKIRRILMILEKVGLGYIQLGQPATLLSGGEAQRIKLSAELSRRSTGQTLYILDEPTTGLHFYDVSQLLEVLYELRDLGNTIIIIEHNMDVIKSADHIIDLGPEGGDDGGYVVATGTPQEIAENPASYTGQFLKELL